MRPRPATATLRVSAIGFLRIQWPKLVPSFRLRSPKPALQLEVNTRHKLHTPGRASSDGAVVQDARDPAQLSARRDVRFWIAVNGVVENVERFSPKAQADVFYDGYSLF